MPVDFEPTDVLSEDDPDRGEDPAESSGDAAAGAAATAQPIPNPTSQPAIRPAFFVAVRVIDTTIALVSKVRTLLYAEHIGELTVGASHR